MPESTTRSLQLASSGQATETKAVETGPRANIPPDVDLCYERTNSTGTQTPRVALTFISRLLTAASNVTIETQIIRLDRIGIDPKTL